MNIPIPRYPGFVQTSLGPVLSCAMKFRRKLRWNAACVLTMPEAHQSPFRSRTGRLSSATASHLSSLFSYSCALFCIAQEPISLLFIRLRTLLQNHGGVGVPPSGPPFRSASSKLFEELPRGLPGWFAEIALAMALRNQATQALKVQACFPVLGVRVDAVQIIDVVAQMEEWIREKAGCHSIAATGMHGIVEAQH